MCPFKKNKCGEKQNVTFSETDKTEEVKAKNLTAGESCTYMIKSSCGSPAFSTKNFSGMNDSNVNITFIEFEKEYVKDNMAGKDNSSTTSSDRTGKQPSDDKPNRNQTYKDMGSMNSSCSNCTNTTSGGKQYMPSRKRKNDSTYTN